MITRNSIYAKAKLICLENLRTNQEQKARIPLDREHSQGLLLKKIKGKIHLQNPKSIILHRKA